jgi:pyridoxal phosphate enzyme (YggS family)
VSIAQRLSTVKSQIAEACRVAGRDPSSVTLLAVAKTVPPERCREAVAAGQLLLAENYAQELRDKAPSVPGARWHFIGPLQRNKVKYVIGTAELIQSLDGRPLADEIAERAARAGLVQRCLVQVNVGDEPQKSGCVEAELPSLIDHVRGLPSLALEGLMCIPPAEGDPRPHFARLRALAENHSLKILSMGMSADFALAIAEGATLVRVGTAIFGAR